jgi:hypothetical protein
LYIFGFMIGLWSSWAIRRWLYIKQCRKWGCNLAFLALSILEAANKNPATGDSDACDICTSFVLWPKGIGVVADFLEGTVLDPDQWIWGIKIHYPRDISFQPAKLS